MKPSEDERLEHFFAEMRQEDRLMNIPTFQLLQQQQKEKQTSSATKFKPVWRAILAVAASGLLLLCFRAFHRQPASLHRDQLIISVNQDKSGQATLDVRLQASIESWQAESDILLTNP